jgi:hypothetical protein
MKKRRDRHDGAAQGSGDTSTKDANEDSGFKTQISALKVFYPDAEVHAQSKRYAGKENKEDVTFAGPPASKQQLLELMGAAQRAGNSRGYAQFEQKLYEQILKVHKAILAQNGRG